MRIKLNSIIAAIALVSTLTINAFSQTDSFGPLAGANFSNIINAPNNPITRTGLQAGVFWNHSKNEHFGWNTKLVYNQLGAKFDNSTLQNRLHYVQLPVSAVYYFGERGSDFRPKVFGGLYGAYLAKADYGNSNAILVNGQDAFKKFDFGGQIGAGFNFRVGSDTWINIDGGYSLGFTENSTLIADGMKNRAFSITAGVAFPLN